LDILQRLQKRQGEKYALNNYFGPHSLILTVTPDDIRVRMFANQGEEIKIPKVVCNEEQCIQDFGL
jgi:hypothetical protein